MGSKFGVLLALALVLSVPFLVRSCSRTRAASLNAGAELRVDSAVKPLRLVIVTPHVEQIQLEFAAAFDRWHRRNFNQPTSIDWRQPGGTSDIIKQLEASFDAAARKGLLRDDESFPPGTASFDLFFGGGSFEHGKLKDIRSAKVDARGGKSDRRVTYRMGQPAGFTKAQLQDWFGENTIGVQSLYDPDQYWIGTALSGFGLVFNRDVLKQLGLPEPTSFSSLADPKYYNMLALADARQSGSVTTTLESIMNSSGWDRGWRLLRELAANTRYFASAATRIPVDVGQGEAAAGVAIDFYGRGQAQFLAKPGETEEQSRVGYVDPAGAVYIDADPVSMLNGASDRVLAQRFIEFCLTDEAQALWQLPAITHADGQSNPAGPGGRKLGPETYELRRMPVRRLMYEKYRQHFIDKSDPFEAASKTASKGWRSAIGPMMAAFAVDTRADLQRAWLSLNRARTQAGGSKTLAEMEAHFYAMPLHTFRVGSLYSDKRIFEGIDRRALDELSKNKVTTIDQLDQLLLTTKADATIVDQFRLIASRRGLIPTQPATAVLSESTFRSIRADTDSWKDPIHGRRTLIAYTNFFRDSYAQVVALGKTIDAEHANSGTRP